MRDKDKTKEQLIDELVKLRKQVPVPEASETARNRAGNEIWGTRDFLETIIEDIMDGIIITDGKGTITSVNGAV